MHFHLFILFVFLLLNNVRWRYTDPSADDQKEFQSDVSARIFPTGILIDRNQKFQREIFFLILKISVCVVFVYKTVLSPK